MKPNRFHFRAWDGKIMHKNVHVINGKAVKEGYQFFTPGANAGVLMQSTGLIDKNGIEIFEGDTLSRHGTTWNVNWSDEQCRFNASGEVLMLCNSTEYEVTGNIYENSEILKKAQT